MFYKFDLKSEDHSSWSFLLLIFAVEYFSCSLFFSLQSTEKKKKKKKKKAKEEAEEED